MTGLLSGRPQNDGGPINTPGLRVLVDDLAARRRALLADTSLSPEELRARLAQLGNAWIAQAPRVAGGTAPPALRPMPAPAPVWQQLLGALAAGAGSLVLGRAIR